MAGKGLEKDLAVHINKVASSYLELEPFNLFIRENLEELNTLMELRLQDIFRNIKIKNKAYDLLSKLIDKQIELVVNWMRVDLFME